MLVLLLKNDSIWFTHLTNRNTYPYKVVIQITKNVSFKNILRPYFMTIMMYFKLKNSEMKTNQVSMLFRLCLMNFK